MDGTLGTGAPTLAPDSDRQALQQIFLSASQMHQGLVQTPSTEDRIQRLEASYQLLTADLERTKASLTRTQEFLSSTQQDLTACRGSNRDLYTIIDQQAKHLQALEKHTSALKKANETISHAVNLFKGQVSQAHQQLINQVTHHISQQTAKIDHLENRIVVPLFAGIRKVLDGDAARSQSASLQAIEAITEEDKVQASSNTAQQGVASTAVENPDAAASSGADHAMRSSSVDSNTPLADARSVRPGSTSALQHIPSDLDRGESASQVQPPMSQSAPTSHSQSRTFHSISAPHVPPDVPSTAGLPQHSEPSSAPSMSAMHRDPPLPSGSARAPVAIVPRPSPSPSQSPSTHHASARSTPQTSRASSSSLGNAGPKDTLVVERTSRSTDTSLANTKRKRTPSVECVRVQIAKTLANKSHLKAGGRPSPTASEGSRSFSARPILLKPSSSAAIHPSSPLPSSLAGHPNPQASAISCASTASPVIGLTHIFGRPSVILPQGSPPQMELPPHVADVLMRQAASQQPTGGHCPATSAGNQLVLDHVSHNGRSQAVELHNNPQKSPAQPLQSSNIVNGATTSPARTIEASAEQRSSPPTIRPTAQPIPVASASRVFPESEAQPSATPAVAQPTRIKTEPRSSEAELQQLAPPAPSIQGSTATPSLTRAASPVAAGQEQPVNPATDHVAHEDTHRHADSASEQLLPPSCSSATALEQRYGSIPRASERHSSQSANLPPSELDLVASTAPNSEEIEPRSRKQLSVEQMRRQYSARLPGADSLPSRPEVTRPSLPERPGQSEPGQRYDECLQQPARPETAENTDRYSHVGRLADRRCHPTPDGVDEPFYIWARLGLPKDWSGNPNVALPLVISSDRVVTENLVSEKLANDLIRQGLARKALPKAMADGKDSWLDLSISWRFDTGKQYRSPNSSDRFDTTQCYFLIVPTAYMKDGICMGRKKLEKLDLKVVPKHRSDSRRAYLGVSGSIQSGVSLCAFPHYVRGECPTKPFEKLCKLAEYASSRKDQPRFSGKGVADERPRGSVPWDSHQGRSTRNITGPMTPPPLSDRLSGTIEKLRNSRSQFESPYSSSGGSRGMSSPQAAREAVPGCTALPQKFYRTDTSPCSTVAHYVPSQHMNATPADPTSGDQGRNDTISGIVGVFDSNSPLSEAPESDGEDVVDLTIDEDEIDQLIDE